jgi:hypothetical protein
MPHQSEIQLLNIDRVDLLWMRNERLTNQMPVVIMRTILFLSQIAILAVIMSPLSE